MKTLLWGLVAVAIVISASVWMLPVGYAIEVARTYPLLVAALAYFAWLLFIPEPSTK